MPHLLRTFRDLKISKATAKALARQGIDDPFPIQQLVLPDAMEGRDVLAHAPTGSGKTLAFAIPIIERLDPHETNRPSALILVPTRELCTQVTGEFEWLTRDSKLRVCAVYGGTRLKQQSTQAATSHIVVATPGRLNDIVQRRMIDISHVQILVLDEADRMLDMGFQPQVDRIVEKLPSDRHTMFFSATLEGKVGRVAKRYTRDPVHHEVQRPKEEKRDITHRFIEVNRGTKIGTLAELLEDSKEGLTLVFVRTKRGADELVKDLRRAGVKCDAMHGDMHQSQRERTLKDFEEGKLTTLIATDVAARGLDLDNINHVIQFDPPDDKVDYVHRVGRTGRAGRTGLATTLVQEDQQYNVGRIAVALQLEEEYLETGMKIGAPRMAYVTRGGNRKLGARPTGWGRPGGRR